MRRKHRFLTGAICAFSMTINGAAVFAQNNGQTPNPAPATQQEPAPPGAKFFMDGLPPLPVPDIAYGPQIEILRNEFSFEIKPIHGAPYSADAETETLQNLADGNRIVRNSTAKVYRDSAGRTRREQSLKAIGPWAVSVETPTIITINDPVAGVIYTLNTTAKTAQKMPTPPFNTLTNLSPDTNAHPGQAKVKLAQRIITSNGAESGTVAVAGRAAGGVVTLTTDGATNSSVSVLSAPFPTAPPTSGVFTMPMLAGKGEVNQESLGKQNIEGVEAEGTRVTMTIPAGQIGNDRPIVTVNERWFSTELQTIVFSKNSDPRTAETTYRLTNINRSEPDPSLFQVPSDYTIIGEPQPKSLFFNEKPKEN